MPFPCSFAHFPPYPPSHQTPKRIGELTITQISLVVKTLFDKETTPSAAEARLEGYFSLLHLARREFYQGEEVDEAMQEVFISKINTAPSLTKPEQAIITSSVAIANVADSKKLDLFGSNDVGE